VISSTELYPSRFVPHQSTGSSFFSRYRRTLSNTTFSALLHLFSADEKVLDVSAVTSVVKVFILSQGEGENKYTGLHQSQRLLRITHSFNLIARQVRPLNYEVSLRLKSAFVIIIIVLSTTPSLPH